MKTKAFIVLFLALAVSFGCSKNSSNESSQASSSAFEKKSAESVIALETSQRIAAETNSEKRAKLLIESLTSETDQKDLTLIIKLYSEEKLTTEEFRTLFWNSSLSKESLIVLKSSLDVVSQISKLDKKLIQSISENSVSFDDLLEEIKSDSEKTLPMSLQLVLVDEMVRLYDKDFKQINANEVSLYERVSTAEENKKDFLEKLRKILELDYYKNILSNHKLVAPANPNSYAPRELNAKFGFDYSNIIGRCGESKGHLDLVKLKTDLSVKCPTETPSQALLSLNSNLVSFGESTIVSIVINSGVIGGYSSSPKEDATTIQNYSLNGKIIIPKCKNPAFCSQIATVSYFNDGMSYGNLNKEGVKITVNGTYFANSADSQISVDVSKQDAVIEISMSSYKKHIGACCSNPTSYQKISLAIENDGYSPIPVNLTEQDLNALKTFTPTKIPLVLRAFRNDLNTPPFEILVVDAKIKEASKNKNTFDDYRSIFYGRLYNAALSLDWLMLNNGSPLDILHYREIQSSLSNKIGRDQIYRIILSKLIAYQSSFNLNIQSNINEMFKSVLTMNMNNDLAQNNLIQLINEKSKNLSEDTKDISQAFINSLKNNTKDQSDLLREMKNFQAEYAMMLKKTSLEMKVLNLELVQFTEVQ